MMKFDDDWPRALFCDGWRLKTDNVICNGMLADSK